MDDCVCTGTGIGQWVPRPSASTLPTVRYSTVLYCIALCSAPIARGPVPVPGHHSRGSVMDRNVSGMMAQVAAGQSSSVVDGACESGCQHQSIQIVRRTFRMQLRVRTGSIEDLRWV